MSEQVVVVEAPAALAGGALDTLNRTLQALAVVRTRVAAGRPCRALLLLDGTAKSRDRKLLLLNDKGDPVHLSGPEDGVFDARSRSALSAAALDTLSLTHEAADVVERLLPEEGSEPVAAAVTCWRDLLGNAGLEVAARNEWSGQAAVTIGAASLAAAERIEPLAITWFGPRHLALLAQIGLAPAEALAGETRLRERCDAQQHGRVTAEAENLATLWRAQISRLEAVVNEEDPRLLGAWMRLRRNGRQAISDFTRRAARQARNRAGIRGARLHRLAQGLRPLDAPQAEHIGLLTAAALFRLDLDRLDDAIPALADAESGQPLCIATESGQALA